MQSDAGMDGRFSLLVMGFCILMCASCSDNVPTTAEDAGVLQGTNFLLCCVAMCNKWQRMQEPGSAQPKAEVLASVPVKGQLPLP